MTRCLAALIAAVGIASTCLAGTSAAPAPVTRTASADTCSFRPVLKPGRQMVYTYRSTTEFFKSPDDPQAPAPSGAPERVYHVDLTLRLGIIGVDERGAATLSLIIDRALLITNEGDMERQGAFTHDEAEKLETPAPDQPLERRLAYALARAAARVDVRADGTVSLVQGLEGVQALAAEAGLEGSRLLGPLTAGADARTLALVFVADQPAPDGAFRARAPGDTWETRDRIPVAGVAELVLTTALKLDACSGGEASATGAVRITAEAARDEDGRPVPASPGQPSINVDAQTDELKVTWDSLAGVLKSRERTSYISMSASVGGAKRHMQTLRTRSVIELKSLTDPTP